MQIPNFTHLILVRSTTFKRSSVREALLLNFALFSHLQPKPQFNLLYEISLKTNRIVPSYIILKIVEIIQFMKETVE